MRLAFVLGSIIAVSLAATFLVQSMSLATVGSGSGSDVLFTGTAVPQFVLANLGASLTTVLVPILSSRPGGRCSRRRPGHSGGRLPADELTSVAPRLVSLSLMQASGAIFTTVGDRLSVFTGLRTVSLGEASE